MSSKRYGKRMAKADRYVHPRLRNGKNRGLWAETAFAAKAMGMGLNVCKPMGDNDPFDFAVFNIRHAVSRVQVKSVWAHWNGRYFAGGLRKQRYKPSEVDFIVVVLPAVDAWYIIPIDAMKNVRVLSFSPHRPKSRARFEKYRDAWHLLTGEEPGAWARYQRFTIHAQAE